MEVRLLADDGSFVGDAVTNIGAVGEIAIKGSFIFSDYDRNPEATRKAFVDDWYRTGDIGFFDNGELAICGRKKEIIIVHGRNYYFHDIEETVSTVPAVIPGRVVAIGVEEDNGEELLVMVETNELPDSHKRLKREIKQAVFSALELTPKYVAFLPRGHLRKTTSGKMSRADNLALFKSGLVTPSLFDAETEERDRV